MKTMDGQLLSPTIPTDDEITSISLHLPAAWHLELLWRCAQLQVDAVFHLGNWPSTPYVGDDHPTF